MRGALDSANLLLVGYPLVLVVASCLWPDITLIAYWAGAAIAVPLFFLQGDGKRIPGRRFPWFQMILAGVVYAWPFVFALLMLWLQRKCRRRTRNDERDA